MLLAGRYTLKTVLWRGSSISLTPTTRKLYLTAWHCSVICTQPLLLLSMTHHPNFWTRFNIISSAAAECYDGLFSTAASRVYFTTRKLDVSTGNSLLSSVIPWKWRLPLQIRPQSLPSILIPIQFAWHCTIQWQRFYIYTPKMWF